MRSTGPGWNLYGERSNPAWLDSRLNFLCPGRLDKAQRKFWAVKGFNVADYDGSPGCTFLSLGLLEQSGVAVGGRGMRVVATFLATEIYAGIARIIPRRRGAHFLLLETLLSRPGFDQRAVYGEVFVGKQFVLPRQPHHLLKERLGDIRFEQPFPILRVERGVPLWIVVAHTHEPAKQQVVIQLLHQQPFAAHAIQALQQECTECTQQLLGRDGGAS